MSDPLSIAAGVVGILTAAAQISSILIDFTRSAKGAPHQAQVIITEVNDTSGILSRLQAFILGKEFADTARTSMLRVDQVINVVSGCVLTFSELQKLLDELETGKMGILDRVKWTRKEATIAGLIQRLQNHKASLSLILNILNGESIDEATSSVNRLFTLVENHYQEMSFRLQTLERHDLEHKGDQSVLEDDAISTITVTAESSNATKSALVASGIRNFDFTEDLQKSRVYKRNRAFRESGFSLSTKSMYTTRWSCLSALSMADVSTISVFNLPITQSEVFNLHRSSQTWSNEHSDPARPLKQLLNCMRYAGTASGTNKNVIYPCTGCGEEIEQGSAFELANFRRHRRCFRCGCCGTTQTNEDRVSLAKNRNILLASSEKFLLARNQDFSPANNKDFWLTRGEREERDILLASYADFLLANNGFLICHECVHTCKNCNSKIWDLAILTNDRVFCSECFKCEKCEKKIESLTHKYASTPSKFFCMGCYESDDPLRGEERAKASVEDYEGAVRLLLDRCEDLNAQSGNSDRALQTASFWGLEGAMQLLLDRGADINSKSKFYGNALQAASIGGFEGAIRLLLDRGADVNATSGRYGNALQAASRIGWELAIRLLLDRGADINAKSGSYGNALQAASRTGSEKAMRLLLNRGAYINAVGRYSNPLEAAFVGRSEEAVRLLLDYGANVNVQDGYALQAASMADDEKVMWLLLNRGADINSQSGYYGNALQAASSRGHKNAVQMLLNHGANINAQGGYYGNALQAASANGHQAVVSLLLSRGAIRLASLNRPV